MTRDEAINRLARAIVDSYTQASPGGNTYTIQVEQQERKIRLHIEDYLGAVEDLEGCE